MDSGGPRAARLPNARHQLRVVVHAALLRPPRVVVVKPTSLQLLETRIGGHLQCYSPQPNIKLKLGVHGENFKFQKRRPNVRVQPLSRTSTCASRGLPICFQIIWVCRFRRGSPLWSISVTSSDSGGSTSHPRQYRRNGGRVIGRNVVSSLTTCRF